MSSRQGWEGTAKIPTDPPTVSPNKQADYVSAHMRLYWPHTATYEDVLDAIDAAWWEAVKGVRDSFPDREL